MKKTLIISGILTILMLITSCHFNEDEKESIINVKSITFKESGIQLKKEESKFIPFSVEPKNADITKMSVISSNEDVFVVTGFTKSGCTIVAKGKGNAVITAKADEVYAYYEVLVTETEIQDPYIVLPFATIELKAGERKTVAATLFGGNETDKGDFQFNISNKNVIDVQTVNNNILFTGKTDGFSTITVSHPKAEMATSFTVIVTTGAKEPYHITSDVKTIFLDEIGKKETFNIEIIGGPDKDAKYLYFEITEGKDVIDLTFNDAECTVKAKKEGMAKIKVTSALSEIPLDIDVVVKAENEEIAIYTEKSFLELDCDINDYATIEAELLNYNESNAHESFSYEIENDEIVEVTQQYNNYFIKAKKNGITKLIISSSLTNEKKEILISVQRKSYVNIENQISTNQNEIITEVGEDPVKIQFTLTGGNEADRNGFEWTVDDSSIIELESEDGKIKYNRNANIEIEKYTTECFIKPIGVGETTVTLEHPKAEYPCVVNVKVFPKNTFTKKQMVVSGESYRKIKPEETYNFNFEVLQGEKEDIKEYVIENEEIAEITEQTNTTCSIRAIKNGITVLKIIGKDGSILYKTIIDVESEENIIYLDTELIKSSTGKKIYKEIFTNYDAGTFSCISDNESIVKAEIKENVIEINTISEGKATVIINDEENSCTFILNIIVQNEIDMNYPYEFTSEDLVVLVKGTEKEYEIDMEGAPDKVIKNTIIEKENDGIIDVIAKNGKYYIKGLLKGKTKVTIHNSKVKKDKSVIIYCVENEEELNNFLTMNIEQTVYTAEKDKMIFINIETNSENLNDSIEWNIDDVSSATYIENGNKLYIRFNQKGNYTITAESPYSIDKIKIYISCIDNEINSIAYMNYPTLIEMYEGEEYEIKPAVKNIAGYVIQKNEYKFENNGIIEAKGDEKGIVNIKALKNGIETIEIINDEIELDHKITAVIYEKNNEVNDNYVISTDRSYYRIKKGNSVKIDLIPGKNGFPKSFEENIKVNSDCDKISIDNNGKSLLIYGLEKGIATVTIENTDVLNSINITIEVFEDEIKNNRTIKTDSIKKVEKGKTVDVVLQLEENGKSINDYSDIELYFEGNLITAAKINNIIRIAGISEGNTELKINWKGISKNILIYCVDEKNKTEVNYPVYIEEKEYFVTKNDKTLISLITEETEEDRNITYRNLSGLLSIQKINDTQYEVTALKKGKGIIIFSHPNSEDLYVTFNVMENNVREEKLVIQEDMYVRKGETKTISLLNELSNFENIKWSADNIIKSTDSENNYSEKKIFDYEGNGNECIVTGMESGLKQLYVEYGIQSATCNIHVLNEEEEVPQTGTLYIINTEYKIEKGEKVIVKPVYIGNINEEKTLIDGFFDNGTIRVEVKNGNIEIEAVKEGNSTFIVKNDDTEKEIVINTSVYEKEEGKVDTVINDTIIKVYKTYYILEKNKPVMIDLDFSGTRICRYDDLIFEYDETSLKIEREGSNILLTSLKEEGNYKVKISHKECINDIELNIRCGNPNIEILDETCLLIPENTVYQIELDNEILMIPLELKNGKKSIVENTVINKENNSILNCELIENENGTYLKVIPLMVGKETIQLVNKEALNNCSITVYVESDLQEKLIFLETFNNYVQVIEGENKAVKVTLKGYSENNGSKYNYKVQDPAIAKVVGQGENVQIIGLKKGETVITVNHPKSVNEAKIYVLVQDTVQNYTYMTTKTPVLETTVSNSLDMISVDIIGEYSNTKPVRWTVSGDSTNIVTIVGSDKVCYLRAINEGIAKITATQDDCENSVEIQVIVNRKEDDGKLLSLSEKIIEMKPDNSTKNVTASCTDKNLDKSDYQWVIYSQETEGTGNVITLISQGDKCIVKSMNPGTAVVRCIHPDVVMSANFTVQVSSNDGISFTQNSLNIVQGTSEFIEINIPDYNEDYINNIEFISDNENVCTVFGTKKACLLEAKETGFAIIKLHDRNTDEYAQLIVNVVEDETALDFGIQTNTISYTGTMSNGRNSLKANVFGKDITDDDQDGIKWNIQDESIIGILPDTGEGREIIIYPKAIGETVIEVTHDKLPGYVKIIYIQIKAENTLLKLDQDSVIIDRGGTKEINVNLTGSSANDYDSINWTITKKKESDGSYTTIAKIIGTGRSLILFGVNEGEAVVQGYYKGNIVTCNITVESDKYFGITNNYLQLYPGQTYDIIYDVKPSTATIRWYQEEESGKEPIIKFTPDDVNKKVQIEALKEGTTQLFGFGNSATAKCLIDIKYNYALNADKYVVNTEPDDTDPGIVNYTVWPPNTFVKVECNKEDVIINYTQPDESGSGKIELSCKKEITNAKVSITQYKDNSFKESTGNVINNIYFHCYYKNVKVDAILEKYDGIYTTVLNSTGNKILGKGDKNSVSIATNSTIKMGDGETHYLILKPSVEGAEITVNELPKQNLNKLIDIENIGKTEEGYIIYQIKATGGKDIGIDVLADGSTSIDAGKIDSSNIYPRIKVKDIYFENYPNEPFFKIKNGKWDVNFSFNLNSTGPANLWTIEPYGYVMYGANSVTSKQLQLTGFSQSLQKNESFKKNNEVDVSRYYNKDGTSVSNTQSSFLMFADNISSKGINYKWIDRYDNYYYLDEIEKNNFCFSTLGLIPMNWWHCNGNNKYYMGNYWDKRYVKTNVYEPFYFQLETKTLTSNSILNYLSYLTSNWKSSKTFYKISNKNNEINYDFYDDDYIDTNPINIRRWYWSGYNSNEINASNNFGIGGNHFKVNYQNVPLSKVSINNSYEVFNLTSQTDKLLELQDTVIMNLNDFEKIKNMQSMNINYSGKKISNTSFNFNETLLNEYAEITNHGYGYYSYSQNLYKDYISEDTATYKKVHTIPISYYNTLFKNKDFSIIDSYSDSTTFNLYDAVKEYRMPSIDDKAFSDEYCGTITIKYKTAQDIAESKETTLNLKFNLEKRYCHRNFDADKKDSNGMPVEIRGIF